MPKYRVTMPDGRTYTINGPAGASQAEVIAAVQRRIGATQQEEETTLGGELKEAAKGIIPGAAGLLETAATGAAALLPEEQEMAVRAKAAEMAGAARETFAAAPGYEESVGRKFGEALGSTVPFFALGPMGLAGRAAATGLGVGAGAGEARQRAETEGGEEDKGLATAAGAVVGASEAIPVFNFVKRLPRGAQLDIADRVRRAFQAGGEEGAQEAAAQIAQNLIARGLYKPDQALIESVGEEGAYGAGVGAFIQVLTDMALGRRAKTAPPPEPPTAQEKLAEPETPPTAPAGTQAAAAEEISKQVDTEATVRKALDEEIDAEEEARLEREAIQAYEREQEELAATGRRQYDERTLREAAEAEALAPVDEDIPYMPSMSEEARAALDMNLGERLMGDEIETAPAVKDYAEQVFAQYDALSETERESVAQKLGLTRPQLIESEIIFNQPEAVAGAIETVKAEVQEPEYTMRDAALEVFRETGRTNVDTLRDRLAIPLQEAKQLRQSFIDEGLLVRRGNTYILQEPTEEAPPAKAEEVEDAAVRAGDIETVDAGTVGRGDVLPTSRPVSEGPAVTEPTTAAVERVGEPLGAIAEGTTAADTALTAATPALPEKKVKKAAEAITARRIQPGLPLEDTREAEPEKAAPAKLLSRRAIFDEAKELYTAGQVSPRTYRAVLEEITNAPFGELKQRDLIKLRDKLRASQQRIQASQAAPVEQEKVEAPVSTDEELAEFYKRRQEEDTRQRVRRERRDIGMRLQRGSGIGMDAGRIQQIADKAAANWKNKPRIIAVQSIDEVPESIRDKVPNDARGFYIAGDVWLIGDNATTEAGVRATLFHESLGHYGLRSMFGRRLREVMLDIYRTNPAMRKAADKWLGDAQNATTYDYMDRDGQTAMAVEEVLAEASSQGEIKNAGIRAAFNRVAALIRRFLRGMGIQINYSNNDVRQVLIEAHSTVITREREARLGDGTIAFQRKKAEARLSSVFNVNLTAPKYNEKIGDGVRGALGNVYDSLRESAIGFLGIDQIAEVWAEELPAVEKLDKILSARGSTEMTRREYVSKNVTDWFELSNKHSPETLDKFFRVANMTTIYQVDPLDSSVQAVLKKPVTAMTPFDKVSYDIVKEYNSMPVDLRKAYKDMREDYDKSAKEFEKLLEQRLGKDVLDRIKNKYDKKKLQVYLPLWRDGKYWLTYTDKNNETITSAYATDVERQRAKEAVLAAGGRDIQDFKRLRDAREGAPPTGFLGEIVKELDSKGVPPDAIDAVYEAYLNYLPAESIRQMRRPREASFDLTTGVDRYGVFGFEPDIFQSYANVAPRIANQLTNLEYAIPIEETMREIKRQVGGDRPRNSTLAAVYNNLEKQVNFIRNPEKNWLVDGASYFSYLWFIAGNISSALINLTQIPMVVAPLLGGKYSITKATAALDRASATYFSGGWDTNNGGRGAFPSDFTFGAADNLPPRYKKLYSRAVAQSIIRRSTGYEITEAQRSGVKDFVGIRARVEHGLGWIFQNSERFNREITLLAAFDLAYEETKDVDKAIDEALKLVKAAHGSALAETGPRLFQQGFGKVMFTFKRFAQAQIYLLSKLFKQSFGDADQRTREIARSQLIGIFGSSFLIAGIQGMPMYGAVEMLANLLLGDDDEPYDFEAYINKKFGDMGQKGLLNKMIQVDVASRTGFNSLIWKDDPQRMAEVGPFLYTLEQAMGPAYGAFLSGQRGYDLFKEGEYRRSIEAITPSFIRNGFKAIRMAEEGVRNKDGTPVIEDISRYNLMMQLVGFTPAKVAEARESAGVDRKISDKLYARRDKLLNQYFSAWQENDQKEMQELLNKMYEFSIKNQKPGLFIDAETIQKSITGKLERQAQSVNGMYLPMPVRTRVEEIREGG